MYADNQRKVSYNSYIIDLTASIIWAAMVIKARILLVPSYLLLKLTFPYAANIQIMGNKTVLWRDCIDIEPNKKAKTITIINIVCTLLFFFENEQQTALYIYFHKKHINRGVKIP